MQSSHPPSSNGNRTNPFIVVLFWLYVGIPLAWGVSSTLQKAMALFH
ncbi:MAG: oxalate:formate antiporter [Glaciimonas sp.]|nr:oxalate:formate antiporter [Glaciimonas sp.]